MDQIIANLKAIENTLDLIEIRGTYDNSNRMLGIHQTIRWCMEELKKKEAENNDEHGDV